MAARKRLARSASSGSSGWRQRISWGRFLGCAAVGLLLATAGGVGTAAILAQKRAPPLALKVWPGNPVANNRVAATYFAQQGERPAMDKIIEISQRSIRAQGLNPEALRNIGLAQSLNDRGDAARPLFDLAFRQRRRDGVTNLWLAEDAIRRGENRRGLILLDRALRVEGGLQQTIFPMFARALPDPAFSREIAPFMARRPDWALNFVAYALNESEALLSFAGLVESQPAVEQLLSSDRRRLLVRRLAETGEYVLADALYRRWTGQADRPPASYGFGVQQGWPPFDWSLGASGSLSVTQLAARDALEVTVTGSGSKRVAWRVLHLEPGVYRFSAKAEALDGELSELGLRVTLSCADGGSTLLGSLGWVRGAQAVQESSLEIPRGCEWQWLNVRAIGVQRPHSALLSALEIDQLR